MQDRKQVERFSRGGAEMRSRPQKVDPDCLTADFTDEHG
jgi:hypothetical protein